MDNEKHMDNEIWKSLEFKGLPNYSVSNLGRVRNDITGKYLNGSNNGYGYITVNILRKRQYIHRLVGFAFVDNPENKAQIDHINGDKSDNRACNLRWVTAKENCNNPLFITAMREANLGEKNPMHGKHPWNYKRKKEI